MREVVIHLLIETLAPMTHDSGTVGNESLIAQEPVESGNGTIMVPKISGNAIRHCCVRQSGGMWLRDFLGFRGDARFANFLLSGGAPEKSEGENTLIVSEMYRLLPHFKLLGGSVKTIIRGQHDDWIGTLVCEENRRYFEHVLPGMMPEKRIKPAAFWTPSTPLQYNRTDLSNTGEIDTPASSEKMMLWGGQYVMRGAVFHTAFHLHRALDVDVGALLLALRCWANSGAILGGKSRIGHGRTKPTIYVNDVDTAGCVEAYVDHMKKVKPEATMWLAGHFMASANGDAPQKPARGRKPGKVGV